MLQNAEEGHIVNTSSINGFWVSVGPRIPHTAYSAAKFAVKGFTEALIADLRVNAPHIRCSVVMPGQIGTSIRANTRKIHSGDRESNAIDAAGLAQARERFALLGRDVSQLSDDQLRNLVSELERRFHEEGLTTAAQAATIILDGVKANRWRILVGPTLTRSTRWSASRRNAPTTSRSSMNSPARQDGSSASLSRTLICARRIDHRTTASTSISSGFARPCSETTVVLQPAQHAQDITAPSREAVLGICRVPREKRSEWLRCGGCKGWADRAAGRRRNEAWLQPRSAAAGCGAMKHGSLFQRRDGARSGSSHSAARRTRVHAAPVAHYNVTRTALVQINRRCSHPALNGTSNGCERFSEKSQDPSTRRYRS